MHAYCWLLKLDRRHNNVNMTSFIGHFVFYEYASSVNITLWHSHMQHSDINQFYRYAVTDTSDDSYSHKKYQLLSIYNNTMKTLQCTIKMTSFMLSCHNNIHYVTVWSLNNRNILRSNKVSIKSNVICYFYDKYGHKNKTN